MTIQHLGCDKIVQLYWRDEPSFSVGTLPLPTDDLMIIIVAVTFYVIILPNKVPITAVLYLTIGRKPWHTTLLKWEGGIVGGEA